LTYYGPPQENPNVAMAKVLTGGIVKLGLGIANADVLKSALSGNQSSSNNSTYIERTNDTANTATSDIQQSTSVSDFRESNTSITDTETIVSDTSTSVSDTTTSTVTPSE
jgi:hypothetical protein